MDLQSSSTLSLDPFTLYPVTLGPVKTCFESQEHKILCSITGPYYDRSPNMDPLFQIKINSAQDSQFKDSIHQMSHKMAEILNNVVLKQKYKRMKFDINFDIIESSNLNILSLYAPLTNLLCYSCVLNGLQIKSLFTCCGLSLVDEKSISQLNSTYKNGNVNKSDTKSMVLAVQHLDKESVLNIWEGDFVFLHYQRLANTLLSCNEQLVEFMKKRINEGYQQFE